MKFNKLSATFLFFSFVAFVFNLNGQVEIQRDTTIGSLDWSYRYSFEKWRNHRTKTLRRGKGLTINLQEGDTLHQFYGRIYKANDSMITLIPTWEVHEVTVENDYIRRYSEFENCLVTLPSNQISSMFYDSYWAMPPMIVGWAGIFSAAIVAPLVSIDNNSPNNFNSKRYVNTVMPSLIVGVTGLSIGFIINGGENRFRLKSNLYSATVKLRGKSKRMYEAGRNPMPDL